ncbi:MAG: HD domain-containing phosphohydrolase [Actinomycetota bacterium]
MLGSDRARGDALQGARHGSARILVVDDYAPNVLVLEELLRKAGYTSVTTATDSRRVLPLFMALQPDLILLDLNMPHLDGYQVMEQLRPRIGDSFLPVLVLTAHDTPDAKRRALKAGANDFLAKPFDGDEVLLRVANLLQTRMLHQVLRNQNKMLEDKVRERTNDLDEAQIETMYRLALAAEYRDDETGQHAQRVGRTSALIAGALGLARDEVELIRRAAPLHDLGKIGISDDILLKPGGLTEEEFDQMRNHTTVGARILSASRFRLLQFAEDIALTHHEKWDGGGYIGLEGDSIPLAGRIVAVADVFDALTHERPYKHAWSESNAVAEIAAQARRQFDPTAVEAFLALQKVAHLSDPEPEELGPALPSSIDIQEADIEEARLEVLSA